LQPHFADLIDPRSEPSGPRELLDLIGIALRAVLSGAAASTAIAASGHAQHDWLAPFFRWTNGIPARDTRRRVVCRLDPEAFPQRCAEGIAAWATCGVGDRRLVPIDGKTVRRGGRRGRGLGPPHRVSAWAGAHPVRRGPVAVADQSHASTALPKLREWLDRSGAWVTLDALGCPKAIAATIVEGGGDAILAVKENPPHPHEDMDAGFTAGLATDFAARDSSVARTAATNRGREELRECRVITWRTGLRDAGPWTGLTAIRGVPCQRVVEGVASLAVRYDLGGFVGTAEEYRNALRGHWGLANSWRWVLDGVFRADDSRHHAGNGCENLAWLRKRAISRLKQEKTSDASLKTKRPRCGWDHDHLAKVLAANKVEDA
jgi:predicted transposase YbfD/YdcC